LFDNKEHPFPLSTPGSIVTAVRLTHLHADINAMRGARLR
jgi:hypothetical protein